MTTYRESRCIAPFILSLTLKGDELPTSGSGRFKLRTHAIGRWVGHKACLEMTEDRALVLL